MGKDTNTLNDLRRAILHQTVIGGDVGLALGGVDNECVDFVAAAAQLGAGRETRAAQSGHAKLVNTLNQRFAGFILIIVPPIALNPAVFAIGINNDAHFRQRGRVGGRVGGDGRHDPGCWGMHRQHSAPAARQRLAAQDAIARLHAQLTFRADMLL